MGTVVGGYNSISNLTDVSKHTGRTINNEFIKPGIGAGYKSTINNICFFSCFLYIINKKYSF